MIRDVVLAFDDWVGIDGSVTSDALAARLGRYDQLAVHAIFDTLQGVTTGIASVNLLQSANGHEWLWGGVLIDETVDPTPGSKNDFFGSNSTPTLPLLRMSIGCSIPARARIYVIVRDPSG